MKRSGRPENKIERSMAAKTFGRVVTKVNGSSQFTEDEKAATKMVGKMVTKLAVGWNTAGAKRSKTPSKSALYLRMNRAQNAVKAAREAGMGGRALAPLIDAAGAAERDYNKAVEKERKSAKKK
jgi:hypothetical protein